MFDLKIIGGTVIDGTGSTRKRADIGIHNDKIVAVEQDLSQAESAKTIDATGKIVSPGFIDIHTHSDLSPLYDPHVSAKIRDGVTTEVVGNCGIGVAPVSEKYRQDLLDYLGTRIVGSLPVKLDVHWDTFAEYVDYVNAHPSSLNLAPLVAQGTIRIAEMGFSKEKATADQIKRMQDMVSECMADGGIGLSSGLIYMPGTYTCKEEMAELAKKIKPYNGVYVTHMRNEGDEIWDALDEAMYVARTADVPLEVSHLKLSSKGIHHRCYEMLDRFEKAESEGMDVSFDLYPFTCGFTSLGTLLPPWAFEGGVKKMLERVADPTLKKQMIYDMENALPGWQSYSRDAGWDNLTVSTVINESSKYLEGKTIRQIADDMGVTPFEACCEMLRMENGRIQIIMHHSLDSDMETFLAHPRSMFGSDTMALDKEGVLGFGKPHPRAYSTHGIILGKYVREKKLMSLETAIKKMTGMPAARFSLDRRGLLKEGYYADVTIFDADTVQANATYTDPKQYTTGISHVVVNGKVILDDGVHTEDYNGRIIGH